MQPIIDFINYFLDAISGYDYLNEYEISHREINILPNFYILIYFIRKK